MSRIKQLLKISSLLLCLLILPVLSFAVDCFECHNPTDFKGRVVHAPVAKKACLSCHGPHVSRHEKLLLGKETELCFTCHKEVAKTVADSPMLHAPVRDGQCSACHDPHASEQGNLLKKAGGALCFDCHADAQKSYKVSHPPFSKGQCNACHAPHGGSDQRLLKETGSALCFGCHSSTKALQGKHLDMDLRQVDCLSCHHPHGGDSRILLRSISHKPFAEGKCKTCHSSTMGVEVCLNCHKQVLDSFNKVHNHLGIAGNGNPCVACHDPHVGDLPGLLPANVGTLCRDCHADTFERREKNLHGHGGWNQCSDCHQLHGSDGVAMLINGNNVCAECHEQHKGFTHPIGDDALDPRNGQPMDCLTCHNANDGSMYRYYLRGSGERGLCVQCHQSY
ncbi:MAG TPA: cytochrome c3 family protein [Malonomonas sp.]